MIKFRGCTEIFGATAVNTFGAGENLVRNNFVTQFYEVAYSFKCFPLRKPRNRISDESGFGIFPGQQELLAGCQSRGTATEKFELWGCQRERCLRIDVYCQSAAHLSHVT